MSTVLLLNLSISNQKPHYWDFPGGPEVKSLDCHAGDAGSIPGQETRILQAHVLQLPSPQALEAMLHNRRPCIIQQHH